MDGMHPTIVGYALLARAVLGSIERHEKIKTKMPSLERAYRADTLLRNTPNQWSYLLWLWRNYRRSQAMKRMPKPVGLAARDAQKLLPFLQFKTS